MRIKQIPIDQIIPYPGNPRKNEGAVGAVAASIEEFGFQQPIVVDSEMVVIVGHTRLLAAQQLELKTVPVLAATNLSPAQVRAYRLADNRTGENADWDEDLLALELGDLDGDIDLSLTGFSDDELSALMGLDEDNKKNAEDQPIASQFLIVIEFSCEPEQLAALESLMEQGYECRALTS